MKKQGFGLLDILLTIAVSAVILVMGINYYQNVSTEQKINQTLQQLREITHVLQNAVAESNTTTMNNLYGKTNIASNLSSSLSPSNLTSLWNHSALQIQGLSNSSTCLQTKITVCGLPNSNAASRLTSKFNVTFPAGSATTSGNCVAFTICLQ